MKKIRRNQTTRNKIVLPGSKKAEGYVRRAIIFYVILVIAIIHTIITALPFILKDRALSLYGRAQQQAVIYNQEPSADGTYKVSIVWYRPFRKDQVKVGDHVVVKHDRHASYLFVDEIISIDFDAQTFESSNSDQGVVSVSKFSDIVGTHYSDQKGFDLMHFTSTTPKSFVWLLVFKTGLVVILYIWMKKKTS